MAYYQSSTGPGVLAPRGWHCFGTYGSGGSSFFITPEIIDENNLFGPNWHGFTGRVIELALRSGDTSGADEVARVIARVFPKYKAFAQAVISGWGLEITFGPYRTDKLTYKSDRVVEYRTPPNSEGSGR